MWLCSTIVMIVMCNRWWRCCSVWMKCVKLYFWLNNSNSVNSSIKHKHKPTEATGLSNKANQWHVFLPPSLMPPKHEKQAQSCNASRVSKGYRMLQMIFLAGKCTNMSKKWYVSVLNTFKVKPRGKNGSNTASRKNDVLLNLSILDMKHVSC